MTSAEIRQSFLDFFKEKQHSIVPSSSLMPDSPILLFTTAGMNQFVPIFLSEKACPYKPARAADTQKCIRAGGKHNDLEDVGLDTYHHTFFEMLGNWSFGDYFKKEAISWAWELVVDRWKFPANRLYATVYSPDKTKGDPADFDQEAWDIWAALFRKAGLDPAVHIVNGNKKDNFWMMGETGPCGPCSELHVDLTPAGDTKGSLVNQGDARCIEIWNLVFIQFNANPDGSFSPLPAKHVDTGMGFERVCSIIQGTKNFSDFKNAKISNYETDVFAPIFRELEKISGKKYGSTLPKTGSTGDTEQEKIDVAFRVIADHIRTLSFSIADGIQPGNDGRNYVLRRILRRAVRYGRELGFHELFFYKLVAVVAKSFGSVFPELIKNQASVEKTIRTEEESFSKTLDRGIELFEMPFRTFQMEDLAKNKKLYPSHEFKPGKFPGDFAFELCDTYGFPLDLIQLMAREKGYEVDIEEFNRLMAQQRERSRAAQKKEIVALSEIATKEATRFNGYETLSSPAKVLEVVSLKDKTAVILDSTPCYAEMGGQVGDSGSLTVNGKTWTIQTTQKSGDVFLHFLDDKIAPEPGTAATVSVSTPRRAAIQSHHSVTHILHWALHEVVSRDISQKGSFVSDEKLTFDFNSAALTPEQVREVESLVNKRIAEHAPVSWTEVKHAQVKGRSDVMQFFGDKYGDIVRVVQIGGSPGKLDGYSMELCGGTHVRNTSEIGPFRIVSEGAIAAGVRRIEAMAGQALLPFIQTENAKLAELFAELAKKKAPSKPFEPISVNDIEKAWAAYARNKANLEIFREEIKEWEKEQARNKQADFQRRLSAEAPTWIAQAKTINGIPFLTRDLGEVDSAILPLAVGELKKTFTGVVVLACHGNGRVGLIASVSADFTAKIQAGKIIQAIAPMVGGKGGGKPDLAQGGGTQPEKIGEALTKAQSLL